VDVDPWTLATVAGVSLVALGTRWFVQRFAAHGTGREQLRKAKRRDIGTIRRDGQRVKVAGTVQPVDQPLRSPFGQIPCVAYRVRAVALADQGPLELVDEVEHLAFALEDETGRARVDAPEVRFELSAVKVLEEGGGGGPFNAELRDFLREHGRGAAMGERVIVEQAVLEVGAQVEVLGCSRVMVDPRHAGRSYREPARELLLEELPDGPVIVG
jgi:hypothetical protein